MAVLTVSEFKQFARLDPTYVDDDSMIQRFLDTAEQFVENSTGKKIKKEHLAIVQAVSLLSLHWYENRMIITSQTPNDVPYALTSLLNHIANCTRYEKAESGAAV